MKSGVAAIMTAARGGAAAPQSRRHRRPLVADEEWGSAGTEAVLREVVTDAAIVAEPATWDLVVAHRGFAWAEVTVHGGRRPRLPARPGRGCDHEGRALPDRPGGPRRAAGRHGPLRPAGWAPAACTLPRSPAATRPSTYTGPVLDRHRAADRAGEDAATTDAELRAILTQIAAADPAFRFDLAVTAQRPPFAADPGSASPGPSPRPSATSPAPPPRPARRGVLDRLALLGAAAPDTVMFGVAGGWRARRDGMGHALLAAHRHRDPDPHDRVLRRLTGRPDRWGRLP